MNSKELFELAKEATKNAYAPYSEFKVGAALLTKDGNVFTGVNIENSSYPAGICAERSAMASAISAGKRDFEKIAICALDVSNNKYTDAWPCGICRQFMYEFSPEMKVISGEDVDHIEEYTLAELLPKGFKL